MVSDLIKKGETEALADLLSYKVWLYLVGWVILFILGLFVQYKSYKANKDEKAAEEKMMEPTL